MRTATRRLFLSGAALLGMCAVSSAQAGTSVVCNGNGRNPEILHNTSTNCGAPGNVPTIGNCLQFTLDCSGYSPNKPAFVVLGIGEIIGIPSKVFPPTPSKWGEIILNLGGPTSTSPIVFPHGSVPVQLQAGIPPETSLIGVSYTAQGICGSSPVGRLSNALFEVIGQSG